MIIKILCVFLILIVVLGALYQMIYDLIKHEPLDKWSIVLVSAALIYLIYIVLIT